MEPTPPLGFKWTHPGSERTQLIRSVSANAESGQIREEIVSSEEEGKAVGGGEGMSNVLAVMEQSKSGLLLNAHMCQLYTHH